MNNMGDKPFLNKRLAALFYYFQLRANVKLVKAGPGHFAHSNPLGLVTCTMCRTISCLLIFIVLTLTSFHASGHVLTIDTLPHHSIYWTDHGAIRRGDSTSKKMAIVFSGCTVAPAY